MRRKRKGKKMSAQQVATVPQGAKLVYEDGETRFYLAVDGTVYLVRLEFVTYKLRGPALIKGGA
jgi:hypothetical protein